MDPDRYAFEQAMGLRDDWQFSRIFSTEHARPGFTALLALRAEMQQVLAQAGEPGIATVKFEWWRNEIEQGFAGNAQHPLAKSLGQHLRDAGSAAEYCLELVDAAEIELESAIPFSEQDFQLYLYRSGGVLAEQLVLLSGRNGRPVMNTARKLGQLKRFNDLVWSTGAMLRAGRWLFPGEWLERHTLTLPELLKNPDDVRAKALQAGMFDVLDGERINTRTAMQDVSLPPALALQWALLQKDYVRLRAEPALMFTAQPSRGNGLARLWTAWRGARQAMKDHRQD